MTVQVQDHAAVCVFFTGSKGNGKTTLQEKIIRKAKARKTFIYDHKDADFSRRFKIRPCYTLAELEAAIAREKIIIFNPERMFPGDKKKGFEFFSDVVWEASRVIPGVKNFVSDELQSVCDQHTFPDGFAKIIGEGRTYQIDCYFAATTIDKMKDSLREQITEVFAFRHGDIGSCDWLKEQGISPKEIFELKPGEWFYKHVNTGETERGGKYFVPKNAKRDLKGL